MPGWVYILKCANDSYYVGSTKNLTRRLKEHEQGRSIYTSQVLPIELVYTEYYEKYVFAAVREKELKGWTREKKEALINEMKFKLPELSECRNESHYKNKPLE